MATETIIQKESPEVEAYKLNAMEQAKLLTGAPPTGGLPAIQAAGMDPLQTKASDVLQSGIGAYQPQITAAQGAFDSGIGALQGSQGQYGGVGQFVAAQYDPRSAQAFMNPYQQAVQDEIMRAYDMQRNEAASRAAQAGAFGGSRQAVQQSELGRNEASALAKSQADNYLQAQQAAMRAFESGEGRRQSAFESREGRLQSAYEAAKNRALQGAQQFGQFGVQQAALGELESNLNRADAEALANMGAINRGVTQAQLEAARQTEMQKIYEPYQRLGFYSDILRGAPSTQQQITMGSSANPTLLNQIVGGATSALGLYGAGKGTGLI